MAPLMAHSINATVSTQVPLVRPPTAKQETTTAPESNAKPITEASTHQLQCFDVSKGVNSINHKMDRDLADYLAIHKKLGHMPWAKLQILAKRHIIPHKYALLRIPKCPSCLYGKAHCCPWCDKAQPAKYSLQPSLAR